MFGGKLWGIGELFCGNSELNLDEKGRLAIPTRYRAAIKELCEHQLMMTVSHEGCLLLYPMPEWIKIRDSLMQLPNLDTKAKALQRFLLGHASDCEMDSQGRVLIPESLRKFANLEKRVVLTGLGKKFEIWDEETWQKNRAKWAAEMNFDDLKNLSPELANLLI